MNQVIHFLDFVDTNKIFAFNQKTLLAVSGGLDSVAMTHLYKMADLSFAIAHCNFGLRDKESDDDETFCRKLADEYDVSFFTIKFDTLEYAQINRLSIQTAARELRYKWLEEIRKKHNLDFIATAHHLDDNAETMLFNMSRGTGYTGLSGIPVVNNKIVRPLMCFQKNELIQFVEKHNLSYREDSSNAKTDYTRNKIRHQVIPHLKEINPAVIKNFASLSHVVKKSDELLNFLIDKEGLIIEKGNEYHIPIKKINNYPDRETVLFHLLKRFGFTAAQTKMIKSTIKSHSGKYHETDNFKLIRDRDYFLIVPKQERGIIDEVLIEVGQSYKISDNIFFETDIIDFLPDYEISKENNHVALDYEMLTFPLTLRQWRQGDAFQPFGMEGTKKISDFLIDIKMPIHKKDEVLVLLSGDEIVWVVNHRPDNRYAITPQTNKIFLAKAFSA